MNITEETKVAWKLNNGLWYAKPVAEAHWRVCPLCGGTHDDVLHIRSSHFMVCSQCNVAWYVGSNMLSAWKELSTEEFETNREKLFTMQDADAIYKDHQLSQEDQEERHRLYQEQRLIYEESLGLGGTELINSFDSVDINKGSTDEIVEW